VLVLLLVLLLPLLLPLLLLGHAGFLRIIHLQHRGTY
jgi:hypothetical protein